MFHAFLLIYYILLGTFVTVLWSILCITFQRALVSLVMVKQWYVLWPTQYVAPHYLGLAGVQLDIFVLGMSAIQVSFIVTGKSNRLHLNSKHI